MRDRARALATLALTAAPGVGVEEVSDDIGVDLIARWKKKNRAGLRQFGVELRYVLEPMTQDRANQSLKRSLSVHQQYAPFPFPVVMFYFAMHGDQGWYTWVAEPVVASGQTRLPTRTEPSCQPLGSEAVTEIVAAVDRWYDAHYAGLASAAS